MGNAEPDAEPLLDLLAELSAVTDLAAGFPPRTALRTSIIATRLARAIGAGEAVVRAAGLAGILRYLGCTGAAHEGARFGAGSDHGFLQTFADADFGSPLDLARRTTRLGAGAPFGARAAALAAFARPGVPALVSASHCEVAVGLANACGAGQDVAVALAEMYERWDGRGQPRGLAGQGISTAGRLLSAAQTFEVVARSLGAEAAVDTARQRRGGQLDPQIADAFSRSVGDLLGRLDDATVWQSFRAAEPQPRAALAPHRVDDIVQVFAHVADLKSTYLLDHSLRVAELAVAAAPGLGAPVDLAPLRRAALLHDLGRVAVENGIWDKRGPLLSGELARARSHSFHTEQLLALSPTFAPLVEWVGVHERLDGSGYHRRVGANAQTLPARLLAACDVWCALVAERPWRRALPKARAVEVLGEEARVGRLDRDAVRAVLDAVGAKLPRLSRQLVAGLSEREAGVLALVARGLSNKQIGARLGIAEKTAKNHVAAVYGKIGVTTRAGAALFAVQHALVDGGPPEK